MSREAKARIAFGLDVGVTDRGTIPNWMAELLEEESNLPKTLQITHYGGEGFCGVFLALKSTFFETDEYAPRTLGPKTLERFADSQSEMRLTFQECLDLIEGDTPKRAKPKWTLLASY